MSRAKIPRGFPLVKNVAWNIVGFCVPPVAAIYAFPKLIASLGTERFGILTLMWGIVGTAGIFDLGLNRALTKQLAERQGDATEDELARLVWTVLGATLLVGSAIGFSAAALAPWLARQLAASPNLHRQVLWSFLALAPCIPFTIMTSGIFGVIAAYHRFDYINAVRTPLGLYSFLVPLGIITFSNDLAWVIAGLALGRALGFAASFLLCLRLMPALRAGIRIDLTVIPLLLRTGGWITVSNVVAPAMANAERFLIGSSASLSALAYFSTPNEIVSRVGVIAVAVSHVLYPAFAASASLEKATSQDLLTRGVRLLFLIQFPLLLVISGGAQAGLRYWVGQEFAARSSQLLQLLAVCVLLNSYSQVPFVLLQSTGSAAKCAKFQLAELPFYVILVWCLVRTFGALGAALADLVRFSAELAFFMQQARRALRSEHRTTPYCELTMLVSVAFLGTVPILWSNGLRATFVVAVLGIFTWSSWKYLLSAAERQSVRTKLGAVLNA